MAWGKFGQVGLRLKSDDLLNSQPRSMARSLEKREKKKKKKKNRLKVSFFDDCDSSVSYIYFQGQILKKSRKLVVISLFRDRDS